MNRILITFLYGLLACSGTVQAAPVVLYDDTLGTLPSQQPWLIYADSTGFPFFNGTASQDPDPGGVKLTTDGAAQGGYSNTVPFSNSLYNSAFPVLDRGAGFTLSFELQVLSESHTSSSRAGFSVILLGSDHRGIEVGFWDNMIFAQNDTPLFSHGEDVSFDTKTAQLLYELTVVGDDYSLVENGNPLLSGPVRNYQAEGIPYTLGNYLFLGDDTTSAGASVVLGQVAIEVHAVPLPAAGGLLLAALGIVGTLRRARPRQATG